MRYLLIILALALAHIAQSQDALTMDPTRPTSSQDCSNGALDLHIDGDFPLYDVVWYRVSANGVEEEISIASGIQGNDNGEDLNDLVEGLYRVEVAGALCGKATL